MHKYQVHLQTAFPSHVPEGVILQLWHQKARWAVISTVCFIAGLLLYPFCARIENNAYDMRMKAVTTFLPPSPSQHVVVIAINEKTILSKKPFVFWYPDIGQFCSLMAQKGATAVGIDLIPVHSLEKKLGSGYLGTEISGQEKNDFAAMGKTLDQSLLSGIMDAAGTSPIVQGVSGSTVPFYYDILAFMESVSPSSLKLQTDDDSVVRRQPGWHEKEMVSFPAELVRVSGHRLSFSKELLINFSLLPGIPVLDFEEVTSGKADPALIKGRIVILGLLSSHDDTHETAVGAKPGMLIHAAAVETLLSGKTVVQSPMTVSIVILALLCILSFPLSVSRSPIRSILYLVACSAVYTIVSFSLFAWGVVIPVFPHAAVPLIMFCITYPYRYVIEERGRKKLYQAFSYYVSPEVIDHLISSDADQLMKGERRNVCVMFLDIRGFTELSEKHESESIVSMINIFFERLTEIVQNHNGFVNKFIGDGMLAFFILGDEYVDDAIEAAMDICRLATELNSSGALKPHLGDDNLAIGIGLHAGSVILGNIGSKRKMDFTVIGRAVNMASRIESLTKEYSRPILLSSEVKAMSCRGHAFEPLGMAHVKGIAGGVEIFGLLH